MVVSYERVKSVLRRVSSGVDDDDDGGGTLYYVVKPLLNLKHNYECSFFIPTSVCLSSRVS